MRGEIRLIRGRLKFGRASLQCAVPIRNRRVQTEALLVSGGNFACLCNTVLEPPSSSDE